jgi:ABC-2 type transport system ATP-binding protein
MLACLTEATSGNAYLLGKSILTDKREIKASIALSPQDNAIAPGLSVEENLELMCEVHGFSKDVRKARIEETIKKLGLSSVINKKAGKLSGGWKRRLSIAMALISEPKILFLDEPTLGLDVIARHELWEEIRRLKGKTTIILTTHYMEEAEELSDRIGIMKDGRLLAQGTVEELNKKAGTDSFETAFISIVKENSL